MDRAVVEAAVVGQLEALVGAGGERGLPGADEDRDEEELELVDQAGGEGLGGQLGPADAQVGLGGALEVTDELGKSFRPERVVFVSSLPRTRSAKIVRRAVRARALGQDPGDLSTLENPESLEEIASAV